VKVTTIQTNLAYQYVIIRDQWWALLHDFLTALQISSVVDPNPNTKYLYVLAGSESESLKKGSDSDSDTVVG
jgi:hypothetical protein